VAWGTPGAANGLQDQWVDTVIFPAASTWRYRKGQSEPLATWKNTAFDDGSWTPGQAPIGYGDPPATTVLGDMGGASGYLSFYARLAFTIANPAEVQNLILSVNIDDGFVAYLNGTEVARYNIDGIAGTPPAYNARATNAIEPAGLVDYDISAYKGQLVMGTNVVAIQTHNSGTSSSDAYMDARLSSRRFIPAGSRSSPLVFNELRFKAAAEGSSRSTTAEPRRFPSPATTSRATRTSSRRIRFRGTSPARVSRGARERRSPLDLEFDPPDPENPDVDYGTLRVFLTYVDPGDQDNVFVAAAENASGRLPDGWSLGRIPDGGDDWLRLSQPTQGAGNQLAAGDTVRGIVINEIMYHPFQEDDPYTASDDLLYGDYLEYIELYNRGTTPVQLSGWRFSRGVTFEFQAGTVLDPGAYLVIAKDPERIEQVYGLSGVLGPYLGVLANKGENLRLRDANNNTVDEVRWCDFGRWDKWAMGSARASSSSTPTRTTASRPHGRRAMNPRSRRGRPSATRASTILTAGT